ncbi:hypothetical protein [Bradyrhizobium sp. 162]|uniref:hypothetical protein n=1 Tax=Bradyrhizobium sp. 162 TaxID=2782635 RepID=UPI001FF9F34D|nr:hypothetical protein [Bradyrhizobium sp. 162]MCK1632657.1 hypothetical protein [Bradyrhizobium sp. 162]
MSDEDDVDNNPPPLIDVLMENMAIYGGIDDPEHFKSQAEQLLRSFEAIEGRPAADYFEIEEWSMCHLEVKATRFLVLPGGLDKKDD